MTNSMSLADMRLSQRLILDLCGGTGSWSKPYRDAGYTVEIIDKDKDVRLLKKLDRKVWGILAAPPCTEFASSGARWWAEKGVKALREGLSIVDACLRIIHVEKPEWWCLENPVGRLKDYLGKPFLSFQPCDYGDPYTKRTCLWGKFKIPKLNKVEPTLGSGMCLVGPQKERKKLRSITPPGFARAFFEANP